MIIDGELRLSTNQAITTTAVSTNIVDLGAPRDIGVGSQALKLAIYVTEAFAGGTSVQVQFQGSADNSTWTTYVESIAIVTATAILGRKIFPIDIPHRGSGAVLPRYLRLNYVVVGTFTAGKLTSDIVIDRNDSVQYPAALIVTN